MTRKKNLKKGHYKVNPGAFFCTWKIFFPWGNIFFSSDNLIISHGEYSNALLV